MPCVCRWPTAGKSHQLSIQLDQKSKSIASLLSFLDLYVVEKMKCKDMGRKDQHNYGHVVQSSRCKSIPA